MIIPWIVLLDRENIVKILVEKGADVNGRDKNGGGPLKRAVLKGGFRNKWTKFKTARVWIWNCSIYSAGNIPITELLISNGADIDAQDNNGWTALRFAVENGNFEMTFITK